VQRILSAVRAGDCAAVTGLSGAGKSNLLGFIAHRVCGPSLPEFVLVDCNRLAAPTSAAFLNLLGEVLGVETARPRLSLTDLETLIGVRLLDSPDGQCVLVDRFDVLPEVEMLALSGHLRALRDAYKYALTYVVAARHPLDPESEIAELFFAHTLWLGALAPADARWSAAQFAARQGLSWPDATLDRLVALSGGYPSLLRASCEAHAAGVALESGALRLHPAVQRRVDELWHTQPSASDLQCSGLAGNALLGPAPAHLSPAGAEIDTTGLTAGEYRLWAYFRGHTGEVCGKDDLIESVWPEEVRVEGLRDDSLAQLVRRLRRKVESDPDNPTRILTVPGRGYRFKG